MYYSIHLISRRLKAANSKKEISPKVSAGDVLLSGITQPATMMPLSQPFHHPPFSSPPLSSTHSLLAKSAMHIGPT